MLEHQRILKPLLTEKRPKRRLKRKRRMVKKKRKRKQKKRKKRKRRKKKKKKKKLPSLKLMVSTHSRSIPSEDHQAHQLDGTFMLLVLPLPTLTPNHNNTELVNQKKECNTNQLFFQQVFTDHQNQQRSFHQKWLTEEVLLNKE